MPILQILEKIFFSYYTGSSVFIVDVAEDAKNAYVFTRDGGN